MKQPKTLIIIVIVLFIVKEKLFSCYMPEFHDFYHWNGLGPNTKLHFVRNGDYFQLV